MVIYEHTTISGQVRTGRYVIVQINTGGDYLNLKEVKAFGEVQINASSHSDPYLLIQQHSQPTTFFSTGPRKQHFMANSPQQLQPLTF